MSNEANNNAGGNEGGNQGAVEFPGWMSSLPDSHKSNERFAQFKEAPAVWDKFDSLLQAEGKAIVIPDEKATDEQKAAFYTKIGRPETMDGYKITKPADLPEGLPYDPALEGAFKKFAFDNGLSAAQAEKFYSWYFGLAKNGYDAAQQKETAARAESESKLKTDWGAKFDGNKEIAVRAFKTFGKDAVDLLETAKVGNVKLGDHPAFLKVFYEIGLKTMDDKATGGNESGGSIEDSEKTAADKMFPSMKK